jgi:hypothetical protein
MFHYVVWWKFNDLLEERTAYIAGLMINQTMQAVSSIHNEGYTAM